jgi:hypothetical protein
VTIPANGQTTFFLEDPNSTIWVSAVGDESYSPLVAFDAADDANSGGVSAGGITVNAPSLAPGVVYVRDGLVTYAC